MKTMLTLIAVLLLSPAFAQFSLSEDSEARFTINEVLFGRDKTVVGVTTDVTATLDFDLSNPQAASLGTVTINAREFETDSGNRNGAIRRFILESNQDEFQFISFEPTSISGLPETAAVGDSFDIDITGNLSIKGTTLEVIFTTNVTIASETQVQGLASTVVNYKDFNLSIPKVPSVASVEETVVLELEFTATQ